MIHVVGHTAIDHISRVPKFPPVNGSATIVDRKVYFGGGAANIAAGIARLEVPCTLVSAVGGDFAGSEYDIWMEDLGICRQFFVVNNAHTSTAFVFTDDAGDQITFFEWGASHAFANSVAPELDFVHMATADPDFNVRVAKKAKFSSFDPGQDLHRYTKDHLYSIIPHLSLLFANQHEVEGMCTTMEIEKEDLLGMVPMAVFTMSAKGSMLYDDGEKTYIPAIPVEMKDPTGAGDAYRAGFLAAYHSGNALLECCRIGTIAASYAVESVGCQTNLSGWSDIAVRYQKYFGEFEHILMR
ncbi:MAG TPA: carbohydrate kinase family protein [Methanoregulaceae archaeon]|nr:carbohydrate kinase family protein [Methanoregulaceae archaeon]